MLIKALFFSSLIALSSLSCTKTPPNSWHVKTLKSSKKGTALTRLTYQGESSYTPLTFTLTKSEGTVRAYLTSACVSMQPSNNQHQTLLRVNTQKEHKSFIIDLFEQGYKARLSIEALAFITDNLISNQPLIITCGNLDLHMNKSSFAASLKQLQSPNTHFFNKKLITFDLYSQNR